MSFDVDEGMSILERTPVVLRALLEGLPSAWTSATDGPDTWSAFDVVGHLVQGERTDWIPRARLILAQGADRRFAPFDREAQFKPERAGETLGERLAMFAELRAGSLETLRAWRLTDAQLALTGEHPAFGVVTLRQLLATWVAHDLGHIVQVTRTMARRYAGDVGPWRAYLSVLPAARNDSAGPRTG